MYDPADYCTDYMWATQEELMERDDRLEKYRREIYPETMGELRLFVGDYRWFVSELSGDMPIFFGFTYDDWDSVDRIEQYESILIDFLENKSIDEVIELVYPDRRDDFRKSIDYYVNKYAEDHFNDDDYDGDFDDGDVVAINRYGYYY